MLCLPVMRLKANPESTRSPVAGVSTLGQELPKFLGSEDADDEAKCEATCASGNS